MPPACLTSSGTAHVVWHEEPQPALLYIDLHLVHEVTSPQAFEGLRLAGRKVRRPDLTFGTVDHNVPTTTAERFEHSRSHCRAADRHPAPATAPSSACILPTSARPNREWCTSSVLSWASPSPAKPSSAETATPARTAPLAPRLRHRHQRSRARAGHPDPPAEAS